MSDAIEKRKKKEKKVEAREERDFRAHMKCTSDGRGEKTSVTFIYFLERKREFSLVARKGNCESWIERVVVGAGLRVNVTSQNGPEQDDGRVYGV